MSTTTKPAAPLEARLRVMAEGRCYFTLPVREGEEDAATARVNEIAARVSATKGVTATVEAYAAPVSK